MITRRQAVWACAAALTSAAGRASTVQKQRVRLLRVPAGGLQPQAAVDDRGTLHMLYFAGEARGGDVFYSKSVDAGATFTRPLRVNSQPRSAIATGTIRGAQLALGRTGRPHVAWNGSGEAAPPGPVNPDSGKPGSPMLYARLNNQGTAFEQQHNVMLHSFGLDGGGSVAADRAGNVYVAWHGVGESESKDSRTEGEARRQVWVTKSTDDGRTFSTEAKAWLEPTGACGCCALKIFADRGGNISALYRSATESVHRDIYLLRSKAGGGSFQGSLVQRWEINACPMSSMDIATNGKETMGAWETGGQVYWMRFGRDGGPNGEFSAAPGEGKGRKHPRLAINQLGEVLMAWTEGTGWQKGGSLAWQIYDRAGQPTGERGRIPGIPTWSFAAPVVTQDDTFSILY